MKNIHVLPTDNPSRLYYNANDKKWQLCEFPKYHTDIKSTHNIYITNDEESEKGDWRLKSSKDNIVILNQNKSNYKKIILTTDQDIIKDGVQSIDDEFLEWFVKNPSCEWVDVDKNWNYPLDKSWEYKLRIIPKEEQYYNETFKK